MPQTNKTNETIKKIQEQLMTVYDPEFPIVDIYTLWLIYDITLDNDTKNVTITMTFTTPACPMADMLEDMVKQATLKAIPSDFSVSINITFDPMRSMDKIKDQDVRRMFE